MPRPGRKLRHTAVLWPVHPVRGNDGEIRVTAPIQIKCRWEEQKSESISPTGDPVAITGTLLVDRKIEEGSILWKGKLRDVPTTFRNELREAYAYNEVDDVKGREPTQTVEIRNYKNTLPEIV